MAMEKKRLTLTGNHMPDAVYKKLEELGSQRKLTPYVVGLIEKEEQMDSLIRNLTMLVDKMDRVENVVKELNEKIAGNDIQINQQAPIKKAAEIEVVQEGKLNVSERVVGGIEEEIGDFDF